ncbi:hypothetical protein [Mycolicibacterium aubagnense]|uniref:Uncharacterized protein n=1 Tax=Mycolicibacterium aubagnense TaxID=319707 RepID=A0ABM7I7U6_9MYCO|nr:hypothetical protein [Mycolicibacterium aubagnense]WGI30460.1 hypothetical protein QDT91_14160 [Mycolicibacterium aubagnense]BBX82638.1 hypothetical protein MAUB_05110 [Mycolicibacterium aubagnense]
MSRAVAFPHASTAESVRFTTLVALPNLAEGLFSRRPTVTAALNWVGVDTPPVLTEPCLWRLRPPRDGRSAWALSPCTLASWP